MKKGMTAGSVDEYLADVPEKQRAALEKLRKIIKAAAPGSAEIISYRIPFFKYKGQMLVAFAAFKNHFSFFPGSRVLRDIDADLEGYSLSAGTIRFTPDKPLPATLVKKIVKARIKENGEKAEKATAKRKNNIRRRIT